MKAHAAIEMLERMKSFGSIPATVAEDLEAAIVGSQKFALQMDDLPPMRYSDLVEFAKDARLPFRTTYFEIPGVGALLAKEYADAFLLQPFFSINGEIGMAPPAMRIALLKDGMGLVCGSSDAELRQKWDKASNSSIKEATSFMSKVVVATLAVLRCNNIVVRDNLAPAALNKKRERNGKVPFFSFKTLHLKVGESMARLVPGNQCSDRSGPRLHMRRGHIRRLSSGVTTWVQACIVGSAKQGMVMKDYEVSV